MGCLVEAWWFRTILAAVFLDAGEDGCEMVALSSLSSLLLQDGGVGGRWKVLPFSILIFNFCVGICILGGMIVCGDVSIMFADFRIDVCGGD